MKQLEDKATGDLLDGFKRPVGRPRTGKAMSSADRQKLRRERLATEGKGMLTVEVKLDVIAALDAFVRFKDVTKGDVVDRILRGTLLRKR
jgi:hypothetical protein